jgi:TPR repeat protein
MKRRVAALFLCAFISACGSPIQELYRGAGISVALDEERKGNVARAETELKIALARAQRERLGDDKVADSLFALGAFYRRQKRPSDAIHYLSQALPLVETVSGPASERAGIVLAELSAAYAMEGDLFEGRPFVKRLEPLAGLYKDDEAKFVAKVLDVYKIDTEKYRRDIARLKAQADAGDAKAQFELASVYFDGPDAQALLPEIISLYERSASQNLADAQYYLGVLYDKGRGVAVDDRKARDWFRRAAENNQSIAQYNYAVFLLQGRGGPQNEPEAWEWVKKSSAQGYPSAQRLLLEYKK